MNGWNLLWNGYIHTNNSSPVALKTALGKCMDTLHMLNWDPEAKIGVSCLGQTEVSYHITLASLESSPEKAKKTKTDDPVERLQKLQVLLEENLISNDEFEAKKREIISSM